MALGLDRDISDIEEEDEVESAYEYQTQDDEVIDDLDREYLEYLDMEEARRADPEPESDDYELRKSFRGPDLDGQLDVSLDSHHK